MLFEGVPFWLPLINIGFSVIALLLSLLLLFRGDKKRRVTYIVYVIVNIVLLAGALFQAGMLGLLLWFIIGTGGRLLNVLALSMDTTLDLRKKKINPEE